MYKYTKHLKSAIGNQYLEIDENSIRVLTKEKEEIKYIDIKNVYKIKVKEEYLVHDSPKEGKRNYLKILQNNEKINLALFLILII